MNVAVADVAEGHRADARHHRLDQRRGARDELRHPGDGHRDVVLDGAALELLRLDDAFADGPERRGLARVGSERRVADQPVLDGCRQELLQALAQGAVGAAGSELRSEENTSEIQSLMRLSYAVFCLNKNNRNMSNIRLTHINNKKAIIK